MTIPRTVLILALVLARTASADKDIDALYPNIEKLYIDLHENPELAFREKRSAGTLAARLKALGYEVTTGIGGTGVVAILKNGAGPVVMLRTELDALPIEEKTGLSFASKAKTKTDAGDTVSVSHMCGHDLHMAAWAGTAELMAKSKARWRGTLVVVAQPAEEIISGASAMIKDGLFTKFPKPAFALGMHVDHALPAGVVGFHPGFFRAASTSVDITVYGKGGHGAYPHTAIDPVVIAARLIMGLQTIVSRESNPLDPAVVTVGSIHGGSAPNIIPDQVKLQLTVRSLDPEIQKRMIAAIAREAKGESLAANAPKEPLIETKAATDPVYNDPELTKRMVGVLRTSLGTDRVVEMSAQMGAEDFSQYGLAGVRTVLLHVGAVDPAKLAASRNGGPPVAAIHSAQFAPEREPTLKAAIAAELAILIDLLKPS